jgi:hypothetical protein
MSKTIFLAKDWGSAVLGAFHTVFEAIRDEYTESIELHDE